MYKLISEIYSKAEGKDETSIKKENFTLAHMQALLIYTTGVVY